MKKLLIFVPLFLFSLFLWFVWWSLAIISIILIIIISLFIHSRHYNKPVRFVCSILTYSVFIFPKIDKEQMKKLPFPCIFIANHVSFFDLFISGTILPGNPRGIEMEEHFSKPVYGWFISRFGQISVNAKSITSIKKSFLRAIEILANNERSIFIMPEGKRTSTGKLEKFSMGAFYLSKKSGIPIVPIVYKNLFKINNKNSILIRPGKFDVKIINAQNPDDFVSDKEMAVHVIKLMNKELEK